ncbi:MAG: T9SS type A sorting domain-containing protein [Candidatus Latescibacteria bacterium]|jgi:photosystem II stability/assembly factor-like uncharacterized protein|nr:T9SS type A sorting domain-containing protein [Candidatus Latescibacterota bacterium]
MKRSAIIFQSIKNLVFLSIFAFSASLAFCEWHYQDSGTTNSLWDICFVDENNGWAVGSGSTIVATNDGGETWFKQSTIYQPYQFTKVCFVNRMVGYCIGRTEQYPSYDPEHRGILLKTIDGGVSWKKVETGFGFHNVYAIEFIDEQTGWISISTENQTAEFIIKTSDGGETWETQYENRYGNAISQIDFINEHTGWAVFNIPLDDYDHLLFTDNGGKNWSEISQLPFDRIFAVSENVLWGYFTLLYQSNDGGRNWVNIPTISSYPQRDFGHKGEAYLIYPIDERRIYVRTSREFDDVWYDTLLFTENRGETYDIVYEEQKTFYLLYMTGIGENTIWVAGSDGKILKYTRDETEVESSVSIKPSTFILNQNSPNPFNASTSIMFSITHPENITVNIYNVEGKKIFTLVSRFHGPGTYTYLWNGKDEISGTDVASGLYFYEVKTDTNFMRKKMLLIR